MCIDANDTGGWCYQCDAFGSKPGKLDKDIAERKKNMERNNEILRQLGLA